MTGPEISALRSRLRAFGEHRIAAEKHPDCSHRTRPVVCSECGGPTLELTVERHKQDRPGDFHGRLWARCPSCGARQTVLGTVRQGREPSEPVDVQAVACACGERSLVLLVVDRWDEGFYDEGTAVAACSACGGPRPVVDLD